MLIPVGIENNNDDRSIAWALEHAGCFAYGKDAAGAEANMPGAVEEYAGWARRHGMKWMGDGPLEIFVEESRGMHFPDADQDRQARLKRL